MTATFHMTASSTSFRILKSYRVCTAPLRKSSYTTRALSKAVVPANSNSTLLTSKGALFGTLRHTRRALYRNSTARFRTEVRNHSNMASATSFFDFKTPDSTFPACPSFAALARSPGSLQGSLVCQLSIYISPKCSNTANGSSPHREGQRLRPLAAQGQSCPRRQHSQQMRLHAPVRRSRETVQGAEEGVSQ